MEDKNRNEHKLLDVVSKLLNVIVCLMLLVAALVYINFCGVPEIYQSSKEIAANPPEAKMEPKLLTDVWVAPDTLTIPDDAQGKLIKYGRALIANTAYYLGPKGIIQHTSNGMNCQNCHLDAGTKPFGNNYSAVASTYPKFRERSGKLEDIYKRINDCFERSLNGKALDTMSNEMQAIKSYILWLGKDVIKGEKPKGAGLTELTFTDHPADPKKGKLIYIQKCLSCAGYVKSNMPFGVTYDSPQLSDEEAWDVAAYVNSQQHPDKDLSSDWPKISGKPDDHPFGPYADKFTEEQHKFGPFGPIAEFKKKQKKK
ncbi:MAG: cytochrome c class [Bacteroidetes bacterium]|nr:cytochrome c class [Bacteroidota bacterium]